MDVERALRITRRVIADEVLGPTSIASMSLGRIALRPHQQLAVDQVLHLIAKYKGAMLADPVGTGKTYVALAVARRFASTLVITPATLRGMWMEAAAHSGVSISVMSYDSLSRCKRAPTHAHLVIFDEAHRLRHCGTRRYAMAATMCRRARVLLLSATPVQNRLSDLAAELALFLGRATRALSDDELAEYVVRGDERESGLLPKVDGPYELRPADDNGVVGDLVSLPSPVPASDEGIAEALLTIGLLHQWTSSQAALVAALRRRRSRGLGLIAALEADRYPSRAELSAWTGGDNELQLAFPEVASANVTADRDSQLLAERVRCHCEAVARLLERLRAKPTADLARLTFLREIRRRHPGEKILAFALYAETVDGLFRLLVQDGRVAALTARGGRIASGRVARDEILSQFIPGQLAEAPKAAAVDLLLTTDVLSEGLNLQEASVVVHLDLPWNPARMDQRVGRVRRFGSRHQRIVVYVIRPSDAAEQLLAIEQRLRSKLRTAERAIGVGARILRSPDRDERAAAGAAESIGRLRGILHRWRANIGGKTPVPAFAAVQAPRSGFFAAVRSRHGSRLVTELGEVVRTDVEGLIRGARAASGPAAACDPDRLQSAKRIVDRWMSRERGREAMDLRPVITAQNRRRALARLGRILSASPRHHRPWLAQRISIARAVMTSTLSEGAERVLDGLLLSDVPDEQWLESVMALRQDGHSAVPSELTRWELRALIVFQPPGDCKPKSAGEESERATEELPYPSEETTYADEEVTHAGEETGPPDRERATPEK